MGHTGHSWGKQSLTLTLSFETKKCFNIHLYTLLYTLLHSLKKAKVGTKDTPAKHGDRSSTMSPLILLDPYICLYQNFDSHTLPKV